MQTIAGHILYSALACAKLLLELLQETAARIYLRLSVTPCSAAVRAQHLEWHGNHLENHIEKKLETKSWNFIWFSLYFDLSWALLGVSGPFFWRTKSTFCDEGSKVVPKTSLVVSKMDFGTILKGFWRDSEVFGSHLGRILGQWITKPSILQKGRWNGGSH